MTKTNRPIINYALKVKAFLWYLCQYSGLRFIYRKFNPVETSNPPATGFLWIIGIYISLFGIASQRYESHLDRIENRASGIYAQLNTLSGRQMLEFVASVHRMRRPIKPQLVGTCNEEAKNILFTQKITSFDCFATIFYSLFSKRIQDDEIVKALMPVVFSVRNNSSSANDPHYNDLRGADLSGAYFRGVDFKNANLRRADLSGATFFESSLKGANLSQANLSGAYLAFETDLTQDQIDRAYVSEGTSLPDDLDLKLSEREPAFQLFPSRRMSNMYSPLEFDSNSDDIFLFRK